MGNSKDNISRILHWTFGFYVLLMLCIGFYMTNSEYSLELYQWHKSLGVIFSILIGTRIYWSLRYPWQLSELKNHHEILARNITHRLLLILFIAMPVTGLLNSAFSGWSVHVFDLVIVPQNLNENGDIEPFNENIYESAKLLHRLLAYLFTTLIFLHVMAVLKHHFINKDITLTKMLTSKFNKDSKPIAS